MRRSDKKDYLTLAIIASVCAVLVMLLLPHIANAETILTYKACKNETCVTDTVYGEDGLLHICVMQGQTIVLHDLEQKARHGYTLKQWRCTIGKRTVNL